MPSVVILSVVYNERRIKVLYADCRYAECRYVEWCYAECRYAKCPYAECCYAECNGAADLCRQVAERVSVLFCENDIKKQSQKQEKRKTHMSKTSLHC
jgi:hypothetical protein